MVSAVLITAIVEGRPSLRGLLARMARWRVSPRWYGAAAAPLAAGLVGLAGMWAVTHRLPSLAEFAAMPGVPAIGWIGVFALVLAVNGFGEETGWRGFAWPRLRTRHGLGGAALLLAVGWAIWHLPTFWLDTGMRGFPVILLPGFFVGMAAGAVVLGWLYERAHCSVLLVALFHTFLNLASATRGAQGAVAATVSAAVIDWAVAILRAKAKRARAGVRTAAAAASAAAGGRVQQST